MRMSAVGTYGAASISSVAGRSAARGTATGADGTCVCIAAVASALGRSGEDGACAMGSAEGAHVASDAAHAPMPSARPSARRKLAHPNLHGWATLESFLAATKGDIPQVAWTRHAPNATSPLAARFAACPPHSRICRCTRFGEYRVWQHIEWTAGAIKLWPLLDGADVF